MVLRLITRSPRRSGFLASVALRSYPQNLTPASRRQDHTPSPSASAPFVIGTIGVHRIPPRVRDDREPPLMWDGTAIICEVIWVGREAEYFLERGWTAQIRLIRLNKLRCARKARSPGKGRLPCYRFTSFYFCSLSPESLQALSSSTCSDCNQQRRGRDFSARAH
jgi:hypothetical protein